MGLIVTGLLLWLILRNVDPGEVLDEVLGADFRLLGLAVEGVFQLLRALVLLPARLLGGFRRA